MFAHQRSIPGTRASANDVLALSHAVVGCLQDTSFDWLPTELINSANSKLLPSNVRMKLSLLLGARRATQLIALQRDSPQGATYTSVATQTQAILPQVAEAATVAEKDDAEDLLATYPSKMRSANHVSIVQASSIRNLQCGFCSFCNSLVLTRLFCFGPCSCISIQAKPQQYAFGMLQQHSGMQDHLSPGG